MDSMAVRTVTSLFNFQLLYQYSFVCCEKLTYKLCLTTADIYMYAIRVTDPLPKCDVAVSDSVYLQILLIEEACHCFFCKLYCDGDDLP